MLFFLFVVKNAYFIFSCLFIMLFILEDFFLFVDVALKDMGSETIV